MSHPCRALPRSKSCKRISIAVGKLPQARRSSARRFGLALACITRILLLVSLAWLSRMAQPAVRRVMESAMARTGERFAVNLLRHLGVPADHR